jgi:hypothetical protein
VAKLRKENVMLRSIIVDKDLKIAYLKELIRENELCKLVEGIINEFNLSVRKIG